MKINPTNEIKKYFIILPIALKKALAVSSLRCLVIAWKNAFVSIAKSKQEEGSHFDLTSNFLLQYLQYAV